MEVLELKTSEYATRMNRSFRCASLQLTNSRLIHELFVNILVVRFTKPCQHVVSLTKNAKSLSRSVDQSSVFEHQRLH